LYGVYPIINESWNLSYSFETNSWTSFHSYIPRASFFDTTHYYTFQNSLPESYDSIVLNTIWRHRHISNYQKFYDWKYEFVIEWQVYKPTTEQLSTIHYTGTTWVWDEVNIQWIPLNRTFDYGLFYTLDQNTGKIPLTLVDQNQNPYQNIEFVNFSKYVIRTDDNYKISGLYDMSTATPSIIKNKTNSTTFASDINTLNIDFTKSIYNSQLLKGKFVNCRLFFFNSDVDAKKVINIIQTNKLQSIR